MATIRLYIDEDSMDRGLLRALRARGVDVITALDEGMIERSDVDHLDYAVAQGRVLYTCNVADFYQLHSLFSDPGQIARRDDFFPSATVLRRRANAPVTKTRQYKIGGGDEKPRRVSPSVGRATMRRQEKAGGGTPARLRYPELPRRPHVSILVGRRKIGTPVRT